MSDDAATDEYQHPELFSVEKLRELYGPDYRRYLREGAETYIGDLPEGVDQATGDLVWFPPDRTLGSQAVPPGQQTEPWTMPTSSTFWRPKSGMSIRAFITVLLVVAVVAIIVGGMIAGKAAGDMTQYLAPINSLASLALGYWFGAEK